MDAEDSIKEELAPQWFIDENHKWTWMEVLDKAFPDRLNVRSFDEPFQDTCTRRCEFPDGYRTGKYEYRRYLLMGDGEEINIYELVGIEWEKK